MQVDNIFNKYKTENEILIEYIQQIIAEKHKIGDWDIEFSGQSDKLLSVLMYEYASSIQKLTEGKISAEYVINKLYNQMGKLRIGDFKPGKDDDIQYDDMSVTSEEYKKKCRVKSHTGAHAIDFDDNGKSKKAIVLFDKNQKAIIGGKEKELSGMDLHDLSDIRHTIFHEWTHIMEKCNIKLSDLSMENIIFKDGKSTYINTGLSPSLSKKELQAFVSKIEKYFAGNSDGFAKDSEISFGGISTIELKNSKRKRIMHNQISEGVTELIARKVMEIVGDKVKHPERYAEQVRIMREIFEVNGFADTLTTYFVEPHKLITSLENKRANQKDMLHCISEYINRSGPIKKLTKIRIKKDGNVEVSTIVDRVKEKILQKKDVLMLEEKSFRVERSQNDFLDSLKVKPNNLEQNRDEFSKEQLIKKRTNNEIEK